MPLADTSCLAHVALYIRHADRLGMLRIPRCRGIRRMLAKKRHPSLNASIHLGCLFYKRMAHCYAHYLFENYFTALSALFWAFLGRVAVYLLRTVESSGLLYAAGGNFNNRDQK